MQKAIQALNDDPEAQMRQEERERRRPQTLKFSGTEFTTAQQKVQGFVKPTLPEEVVLSGTVLRDIILRGFEGEQLEQETASSQIGVFANNQLIESWCRRHLVEGKEPIKIPGDPSLVMNESQTRAIALMLSQRMSLIQGPPGTGKTRTIIEAINLLKAHWQVPQPILVSAYTNAAVDNLAAGMRARGLKTLRYGATNRIREDLHDISTEKYMERHRLSNHLVGMRIQLTAQMAKRDKNPLQEEYIRNKIWGMERFMLKEIIESVDAVCATCISSMASMLSVVDFPVVFLDEASMATEPASLMPLVKGCAHLAIIGDHKQLPPIIISDEARDGGLNLSMFERFMKEGMVPWIMLDTQYRMHPSISAFPNKAFYDSALSDGTPGYKLLPPETAYLPGTKGDRRNVSFIHTSDVEGTMSQSIMNVGQAQVVRDAVADLLDQNPVSPPSTSYQRESLTERFLTFSAFEGVRYRHHHALHCPNRLYSKSPDARL